MNRVSLVIVLLCVIVSPAAAQSNQDRFQVGVGVTGARSGEFDDTEVGVGVRLSWHPTPLVGAEAEIGLYPREFAAFSSNRLEGLFGVTVGPRIGRLRAFAKVRPGFVRFDEPSEPLACPATVPAPLKCRLAGETIFAVDLGGGLEWLPAQRASLRVDAGDRLMRYPGSTPGSGGADEEDAFIGHDFRFGISLGLRF